MPTVGSAYCEHCRRQVVARKKGCNHMLHAILSIVTGGLWLIIWLLCAITWDDWYCTQCGGKVKLDTHEPETRCPECGAVVDPDAQFCPHCGATSSCVCKKCKTKNPPNSAFCKNCGASLKSTTDNKTKK